MRRHPWLTLLACALVAPAFAGGMASAAHEEESLLRLGYVSDAQDEGERPLLRKALAALDGAGAEMLLYGGDTSNGYSPPPDDWVEAMEPFRDRTLFIYGNHDAYGTFGEWQPETRHTWWAWSKGNLTVIGLDWARSLDAGTEQRKWLEETLRRHADDTVVLMVHVPWWVPNAHHASRLDFKGDAGDMDGLVRKYDVELVLGAHEHYYARMERNGATYVVSGAVEATTRSVPESVAADATVSTSEKTWMRLDVLPCGIAAWAHHAEREKTIDTFSVGPDVRLEGKAASCGEDLPAPLTLSPPPADADAEREPPASKTDEPAPEREPPASEADEPPTRERRPSGFSIWDIVLLGSTWMVSGAILSAAGFAAGVLAIRRRWI